MCEDKRTDHRVHTHAAAGARHEPTRRHTEESQDGSQWVKLEGLIHRAQDPCLGGSVG